MVRGCILLAALTASWSAPADPQQPEEVRPDYFEGRWTFLDESCQSPDNWTMIAGGNFVSENLVGQWSWQDGKLVLNLEDLAIDEMTGEAGGRFRMDGPVRIMGEDRFDYTIAPEVYQLERCR